MTAPLPNPKRHYDYADGWTTCRIPYRCNCGTGGMLVLCTTDDFRSAVAEAKSGTMLCGACEKQAVKAQPNPVVRLAKQEGVTDAELDEAVHATAKEDGLVGHVRWVVEEPTGK